MHEQPEVIIVSVMQRANGTWCLTYDGRQLGDSKGRTRAEAMALALLQDNTHDGRWEGDKWVVTVKRVVFPPKPIEEIL